VLDLSLSDTNLSLLSLNVLWEVVTVGLPVVRPTDGLFFAFLCGHPQRP
jgi:hypothetical protein